MAAVFGKHVLKCAAIFNVASPLCCQQKVVSMKKIVLKNLLYRSYASSVGKTAAHMMKNSNNFRDKKQDQNKNRPGKVQNWMIKNPTRSVRLKMESTDWPSIFSGAQSYNPALVPVFFVMGRRKHNKPTKFLPNRAIGNLDLMKVPNFFHLSPPAIKSHCAALKPLCTQWPPSLDLSTVPLRFTTRNYLFAGPSLYHPGSRKVKLQVYLKDLFLDDHARRKMIELVGPRYNAEEDELTIVTDRCPTRQQNKDYAMYLLTVLYHESWKTEQWEQERDAPAEESDDESDDKPKRRRKNRKRVILLDNEIYRINQYGKMFKMRIKVKN